MTPSQAAHKYAGDNGFKIVSNGRRYIISYPAAQFDTFVAEVGGYPAALNAMRKYFEALMTSACAEQVEMCAALDIGEPGGDKTVYNIPDECVASGASCSYAPDGPNGEIQCRYCGKAKANNFFGTLEPITPDTVPMSREEMFAPVQAELDRLRGLNDAAKRAGVVPEVMLHLHNSESSKPLKIEALLTPGSKWDDPMPFDDFDAAAQARIRQAANRIAKERRKASGKPSGGPWHVIFNGSTVMKYGYPSRTEALDVVRWGYNHPETFFRNNWRTAVVTLEYRAS